MRTVDVDGERASSTAVRAALAAGDLAHAAALLGRNYAITGRVAHGDKLGRNLGFPDGEHRRCGSAPPLTGHLRRARARPRRRSARRRRQRRRATDGARRDGKPLLEVFMFDFDETIYGRRITVEFLHKLRDEERFPTSTR